MRRPSVTAGRAGVAFVALFGLGLRLWMTTQPVGALDSDMAVLGLMAQHFLDGHFYSFHWGQAYGGSQEVAIAALLGAVMGVDTFTLQLTTILLSALAAVFVWLLGTETVGTRAAVVAACLFWVWPGPFVWWSVKIGSNYWFALAASLAFVWLLARERNRPTTWRSALLIGVTAGLALWANPQTVWVLGPGMLAYRTVIWRGRRLLPMALAGVAAGAAPWLYTNVTQGFPSLSEPSPIAPRASVLEGYEFWATQYLPMIAGVRVPFSLEWVGGAVGPAIAVVLGLVAAVLVVRERRRAAVPILGFAMFAVIFPATPSASYILQPRYALWITPWLVLLVGVAVTAIDARRFRRWVPAAVLLLAASLSTLQISGMNAGNLTLTPAPDTRPPVESDDLVSLLDERGITRAQGDYWLAYRTTFLTDERIIVLPHYSDRYGPYAAAIAASPTPAPHVFVRTSPSLQRFLGYCERYSVGCDVVTGGDYALVLTSRQVTREESLPALLDRPDLLP